MTDSEALEEAIRRTHHERFRELLDPEHPDYNPGYWVAVRQIAGAPPLPPSIPSNIPDRPPEGTGVRLGGCCGG